VRDHTTAEFDVTSPLAIPDGSSGRSPRRTFGAVDGAVEAAAVALGRARVAPAAAVAVRSWRRLRFMI
jgi:hypothetical protein